MNSYIFVKGTVILCQVPFLRDLTRSQGPALIFPKGFEVSYLNALLLLYNFQRAARAQFFKCNSECIIPPLKNLHCLSMVLRINPDS